jgi:hypothetical protein
MNRFITATLLLALAHAGAAHAQNASPGLPTAPAGPADAVDTLYEQGRQAMAPNWRGLRKLAGEAVFIHNDVKRTAEGRLAVWTHHEFVAPEYLEKEKAYLSARERVVIDCKGERMGIADSAYYTGRFGAGAIVAKNRMASPDMTELLPDSMEAELVKTACAPKARAPLRKTKKPD